MKWSVPLHTRGALARLRPAKLELGSLLQRMMLLVDEEAEWEKRRRCQDLLTQLAEDRPSQGTRSRFYGIRSRQDFEDSKHPKWNS